MNELIDKLSDASLLFLIKTIFFSFNWLFDPKCKFHTGLSTNKMNLWKNQTLLDERVEMRWMDGWLVEIVEETKRVELKLKCSFPQSAIHRLIYEIMRKTIADCMTTIRTSTLYTLNKDVKRMYVDIVVMMIDGISSSNQFQEEENNINFNFPRSRLTSHNSLCCKSRRWLSYHLFHFIFNSEYTNVYQSSSSS